MKRAFAKRRLWTESEIEIVRRDYRKRPTVQIAEELGRTERQVYAKASSLGLGTPSRIKAPGFGKFFRAKHALGWTDSEIARAWNGVDRHGISALRQRLGLPCNAFSQWRRNQVAEKTREQIAKAGLKSLAHLRLKVWRESAQAEGWASDLRPRQVQIMNLIWARGPMTREEIGQALGMRKKKRSNGGRPWYPMHANRRASATSGTTWLSDLIAKGLVISLGRIDSGHGPGGNCQVYSLPLSIRRGPRRKGGAA